MCECVISLEFRRTWTQNLTSCPKHTWDAIAWGQTTLTERFLCNWREWDNAGVDASLVCTMHLTELWHAYSSLFTQSHINYLNKCQDQFPQQWQLCHHILILMLFQARIHFYGTQNAYVYANETKCSQGSLYRLKTYNLLYENTIQVVYSTNKSQRGLGWQGKLRNYLFYTIGWIATIPQFIFFVFFF